MSLRDLILLIKLSRCLKLKELVLTPEELKNQIRRNQFLLRTQSTNLTSLKELKQLKTNSWQERSYQSWSTNRKEWKNSENKNR